jgi:hypothetical protein
MNLVNQNAEYTEFSTQKQDLSGTRAFKTFSELRAVKSWVEGTKSLTINLE